MKRLIWIFILFFGLSPVQSQEKDDPVNFENALLIAPELVSNFRVLILQKDLAQDINLV